LAAVTFMASLPGPMSVYYGTETALSGSTPKKGFNDTNRVPMPWDGLDESLITAISEIFRAKRAHPVLTHGARLPLTADDTGLLMARLHRGTLALVAVNMGSGARAFQVPAQLSTGRTFRALAGAAIPQTGGGQAVWRLPPLTVGIVVAD